MSDEFCQQSLHIYWYDNRSFSSDVLYWCILHNASLHFFSPLHSSLSKNVFIVIFCTMTPQLCYNTYPKHCLWFLASSIFVKDATAHLDTSYKNKRKGLFHDPWLNSQEAQIPAFYLVKKKSTPFYISFQCKDQWVKNLYEEVSPTENLYFNSDIIVTIISVSIC